VVGGVVEVAGFEQTEAQMQMSRSLPNMAPGQQMRGFHDSPQLTANDHNLVSFLGSRAFLASREAFRRPVKRRGTLSLRPPPVGGLGVIPPTNPVPVWVGICEAHSGASSWADVDQRGCQIRPLPGHR